MGTRLTIKSTLSSKVDFEEETLLIAVELIGGRTSLVVFVSRLLLSHVGGESLGDKAP